MRLIIALACVGCLVGSALAQTQRQAGAHQHGKGKLDIVIEGATVSMALDVPADDIVGFEHAAKTPAEKATVAAALARLELPLTLFQVSKAAGCTLKQAKVAFEGGDRSGGHADINAEYALECANIAELKAIEFLYFKSFKAAEALNVNLAGPTGQTTFEVSRKQPRLVLPAPKS